MDADRKILIAGPCAAETSEQVKATAEAVAETARTYGLNACFRAGIWKPRTSPNTFQGIGSKGLPWLREAQAETGLPAMTEVATPDQVHAAMQAGLRGIWIGARTGADPIAVQQIADALQAETRKPEVVLVKNPVNEDVRLWIGNIKRFQISNFKCNNSDSELKIYAVHRGCDHRPCWRMAYALRQALPDIPLLLDPSHLSGDASKIATLVRQAAVLGYDGWMIEVHPTPEQALSDSRQQITPAELKEIFGAVTGDGLSVTGQPKELEWLRAQIDEVDETLWTAVAERINIVRRIGEVKRAHGMEPYQPERYHAMLSDRLEWAQKNGLPEETVRSILNAVHEASVQLQRR